MISFALMIACTVAANLFMKAGAMVLPAERTIMGIADWRTLLGLLLFGTSAVVYSLILQRLPLNMAQSIAASQFVAVILTSALILAEPIPPMRLIGIFLILAGILIVSFSGRNIGTLDAAPAAGVEDTPR